MITRNFFLAPLLVFALGMAAWQEKPTGPVLTEVQKLQIQNLTQRLEIAQLKAQAAQAEFDRAREEFTILVQKLRVEGYDLDLQTMSYVAKPKPEKK